MPRSLRVLMVEDDPADAELLERNMRRGGFDVTTRRVETLAALREALSAETWDVVLSDHSMPGFKSTDALATVRAVDRLVPVIVVSGAIGEQEVADVLHAGINSYVGKDGLSKLQPTIERALVEASRLREHEAVQHRLELVQAAVDSANDVLCVFEKTGSSEPVIVYVNRAFQRLTGCAASDFVGRGASALRGVVTDQGAALQLLDAIMHLEPATVESAVTDELGDTRCFETSIYPIQASNRFVSVSRDITERKGAERRLAFLAEHDSLTGLPNRSSLLDSLTSALAKARKARRKLAVFFIDLDGLKAVNDERGHAAGDELLRGTADRIRACLRPGDSAARLGGDEFVAVVSSCTARRDYAETARRMCEAIARGGRRDEISASIGISIYPADGETADDLLRNADAALYHVKTTGRGDHHFYADANAARGAFRSNDDEVDERSLAAEADSA